MPRVKLNPSKTDIRVIEDMAARGAVLEDIAAVLGWSPSTLDRRLKDDPRVEVAYNKGRAQVRSEMASRLVAIASQDGDLKAATAATIFWLKTQAGWSEKPKELAIAGGGVQVYLPDNHRLPA